MALHNYIYLKHKSHDPECHTLIAREHDNRPLPSILRETEVVANEVQTVAVENTKGTAAVEHQRQKAEAKLGKECCGKCKGDCAGSGQVSQTTRQLADMHW
ncbi:LADA_0A07712g1_1 [Lachancea dasiensis]|uniref:LADA_0A07712g1_1 n=1 Tax=Lachancea dasiensis TaxID=1072105 RepID=A0A1G4IQ47_9SACH|nr:LADA_0A07712g1_1 [Lachancea dasiensis]